MKKSMVLGLILLKLIPGIHYATGQVAQQEFENLPLKYEQAVVCPLDLEEPDFAAPSANILKEAQVPARIAHTSLDEAQRKQQDQDYQKALRSIEKAKSGGVQRDSTYTYNILDELMHITRYYYTAEGYLELMLVYNRYTYDEDPFDKVLERTEYTYDEYGNITSQKRINYDYWEYVDDEYYTSYYIEYEYDEAGNRIYYMYSFFDTEQLELVNNYRWFREFSLEHDNVQLYYLGQRGDGSDWINVQMEETELFEDGRVHTYLYKQANESGQWISGFKNIYEGYVGYSFTSMDYQSWDGDAQAWVNTQRTVRFFTDDVMMGYSFYSWSEGEWWQSFQMDYERDDNHLLIRGVEKRRHSPQEDLENVRQFFNEFNENNQRISYLNMVWVDSDWENDLRQVTDWEGSWSVYMLTERWVDQAWVGDWRMSRTLEDEREAYRFDEVWCSEDEVWLNYLQVFREYHPDGQQTYYLAQWWSADHDVWYGSNTSTTVFDGLGRRLFRELKINQNPETMNWASMSKQEYQYDEYGNTSFFKNYYYDNVNFDYYAYVENEYIYDYYQNEKKRVSSHNQLETEGYDYQNTFESFATYPVEFTVRSQGQPLADAQLTIMDETWMSDDQGKISFPLTLSYDMTFDYILEKEGYHTHTGTVKIDRSIDRVLTMTPGDVQLYSVSFTVRKGDQLLESAVVDLTGYGSIHTCNQGNAQFAQVAPEANIAFTVQYAHLLFEGELTVVDQDLMLEVDMDELLSTVILAAHSFRLYPNPATSNVYVDAGDLQNGTLQIFDAGGRVIHAQKLESNTNTVDVSWMESGLYFVRLTAQQQVVTKRLLVQ